MLDRAPPGTPATAHPPTVAGGIAASATLAGKYRVERVIGEGAFGRVYLATDPRVRRGVAVKELLAARDGSDRVAHLAARERFEREARVAGVVQHPHIVSVYELAADVDDNLYLVMEYIDGVDLRALLAHGGSLPIAQAVAITRDIARALDAIHEREIVHRDLKPANILLTRRGAAKLTDFGVAQVGSESRRTTQRVGHPGTSLYVSPEQAGGMGYLDGRSDLYSLGLVLYEMLAGQPYARAREPLHAARPGLPVALVSVVERLLAPRPDDRYPTAAALLRDLDALSAAPPAALSATPPGFAALDEAATLPAAPLASGEDGSGGADTAFALPTPPARPQRRTRTPLIAGGLLALVAVVALLFALRGMGSGTGAGGATTTAAVAVFPTPTTVTVTLAAGNAPAGNAPRPTPTALAGAAPPALPTPSPRPYLATWNDPNGRLRLQYPANWTVAAAEDKEIILRVDGPLEVRLNVYVFRTPAGASLLDTLGLFRSDVLKCGTAVAVCTLVADTRVGGEPAKTMEYTEQPANGGAPTTHAYWLVDHNGLRYEFEIVEVQSVRGDAGAIINSVVFTAPPRPTLPPAPSASPAPPAAWTDMTGTLRFLYPNAWTLKREAQGDDEKATLTAPNVEVLVLNDGTPDGTPDDRLRAAREQVSGDRDATYTFEPVRDARVGGDPARAQGFTFRAPSGGGTGMVWVVDRGGRRFSFACIDLTTRRAEIEALIASVVFLK